MPNNLKDQPKLTAKLSFPKSLDLQAILYEEEKKRIGSKGFKINKNSECIEGNNISIEIDVFGTRLSATMFLVNLEEKSIKAEFIKDTFPERKIGLKIFRYATA